MCVCVENKFFEPARKKKITSFNDTEKHYDTIDS